MPRIQVPAPNSRWEFASGIEYGERIEATVFQVQDWEQTFGQLSGDVFAGSSGLRLRLYAGHGTARPGGFLDQIGYRGETTVAGLGAQYPIIRSRPLNLFTSLQFDYLNSAVDVGSPTTPQSLDEVRTLRFGFETNTLDTLVGFAPAAAISVASVRLHRGVAWLGAAGASDQPGAGRGGSDFGFTKWSGEASRSQPIWAPADNVMVSVYGQLAGQQSSDILPISEKFLFGGNRLGRGFYAGQVTGDTAFGGTAELRVDLTPPPFGMPNLTTGAITQVQPAAQLYLFRDFGRSWENLNTDPARKIDSWGGGIRMFLTPDVQLDLEAVRRLTRRVDAAGSTVAPLAETAGFFRLLTRF